MENIYNEIEKDKIKLFSRYNKTSFSDLTPLSEMNVNLDTMKSIGKKAISGAEENVKKAFDAIKKDIDNKNEDHLVNGPNYFKELTKIALTSSGMFVLGGINLLVPYIVSRYMKTSISQSNRLKLYSQISSELKVLNSKISDFEGKDLTSKEREEKYKLVKTKAIYEQNLVKLERFIGKQKTYKPSDYNNESYNFINESIYNKKLFLFESACIISNSWISINEYGDAELTKFDPRNLLSRYASSIKNFKVKSLINKIVKTNPEDLASSTFLIDIAANQFILTKFKFSNIGVLLISYQIFLLFKFGVEYAVRNETIKKLIKLKNELDYYINSNKDLNGTDKEILIRSRDAVDINIKKLRSYYKSDIRNAYADYEYTKFTDLEDLITQMSNKNESFLLIDSLKPNDLNLVYNYLKESSFLLKSKNLTNYIKKNVSNFGNNFQNIIDRLFKKSPEELASSTESIDLLIELGKMSLAAYIGALPLFVVQYIYSIIKLSYNDSLRLKLIEDLKTILIDINGKLKYGSKNLSKDELDKLMRSKNLIETNLNKLLSYYNDFYNKYGNEKYTNIEDIMDDELKDLLKEQFIGFDFRRDINSIINEGNIVLLEGAFIDRLKEKFKNSKNPKEKNILNKLIKSTPEELTKGNFLYDIVKVYLSGMALGYLSLSFSFILPLTYGYAIVLGLKSSQEYENRKKLYNDMEKGIKEVEKALKNPKLDDKAKKKLNSELDKMKKTRDKLKKYYGVNIYKVDNKIDEYFNKKKK